MSIQVPLVSYPGRGGELPVTLRYSSKQWRINFMDTFQTTIPKTRTEGKWAEDSVAGWTSSLDLPKMIVPSVNYRGPYDGSGTPICTAGSCNPPPPPGTAWTYINRLLLQIPDGSLHELLKDDAISYNSTSQQHQIRNQRGDCARHDDREDQCFEPDHTSLSLPKSFHLWMPLWSRSDLMTLAVRFNARSGVKALRRVSDD